MNYTEYLKQGYINNQIWMGNAEKPVVKFPAVKSNKVLDLNLTNNVIIVGDSGDCKKFLYVELLRNYQPQQLRTTEIACVDIEELKTPLLTFTLGSRGIHIVQSIKALKMYLKAVYGMYTQILSCPETNAGRTEVLILDGILSAICTSIETLNCKEVVEETIVLLRAISSMARGENIKLVYFERNDLDFQRHEWLKEFVGGATPLVFKCDGATSKFFLKTDIACILNNNQHFYMLEDGDICKYETPEVSSEEYDNMLTKLINSK